MNPHTRHLTGCFDAMPRPPTPCDDDEDIHGDGDDAEAEEVDRTDEEGRMKS